MGARLRGRLPEGSGLTAELADDLAENPRQVVAIVLMDVDQIVTHIANEGSTTTVLELLSIEAFDGADADQLRAKLTARHEERTGETALFPADDIPGSSTGDSEETVRQLDLLRQERASQLREKAEVADDKETADQLESDADAFEAGWRDEELRGQLAPAFSDGAQPALVG